MIQIHQKVENIEPKNTVDQFLHHTQFFLEIKSLNSPKVLNSWQGLKGNGIYLEGNP